MALTFTDKAHFAQKGLQFLFAQLTFNGSGEPDAGEGRPFLAAGTNLDRTGAGLYTLTIPGTGTVRILQADFTIVDGTDLVDVVCTAFDEDARTFTLKIYDRETFGVLTDPTDASKLLVQIVLVSTTPESF
jgi:hypothetical protein